MPTIKTIADIPPQPVNIEGAQHCSIRVIFGPKDHAPTFALREFTLAPQGHTPFHQHPWEHEIIILQGPVTLVTDSDQIPLQTNHTALIHPNENHRFQNNSPNPVSFLCLVPIQHQP